jgi:hypothetical protein
MLGHKIRLLDIEFTQAFSNYLNIILLSCLKGVNTNERNYRIWTSYWFYLGSLYSVGHHSFRRIHNLIGLRYLTDRMLLGQPVSSGWPFFCRFNM